MNQKSNHATDGDNVDQGSTEKVLEETKAALIAAIRERDAALEMLNQRSTELFYANVELKAYRN